MFSIADVKYVGDIALIIFCLIVLFSSIVLTVKLRFIQLRMLPKMFKQLFGGMFGKAKKSSNKSAIPAYKALFTAMSTTIGIGNIVGPAVAIRWGGPGALLWFLIALFFGTATLFSEVTFALHYRKKRPDGSYDGGAMPYIKDVLGGFFAEFHAVMGALLLIVWCSNQSNTLGDIMSSYQIPPMVTGGVISLIVLYYLFSGIQKIGDLAAKMVPMMFVLYSGACIWVIALHADRLPGIFALIVKSAFSFNAVTGAAAGYSIQLLFRWGLAKGIYSSEAGVGTATIPHSQSSTQNPVEQGIISMVSAYSVAVLCTLSGLVTLVTGAWQDPSIPLGINMISIPFLTHIPFSSLILACSAFLFALGTILGNAYNGGQCFSYITNHRWIRWYYVGAALLTFIGSFVSAELVWEITDYFIVPVALPNLIAVVILAFRYPDKLKTN